MSSFIFDISHIANTLVSQSSWYNCSLEETWNKHMHPLLTSQATFDEVKEYIDKQIKLGESIKD